ncbi:MAG TPA: hypothetical protein VE964_13245 [Myxococcales bacterium]|nr:hypothetical protein [Myxococcales bacterium]
MNENDAYRRVLCGIAASAFRHAGCDERCGTGVMARGGHIYAQHGGNPEAAAQVPELDQWTHENLDWASAHLERWVRAVHSMRAFDSDPLAAQLCFRLDLELAGSGA